MGDDGYLYVDEEFRRAKRNLLWFCSSAILLWMVHIPADGALVPSMLGNSAQLSLGWFRAAVWFACLYCFIGFYRQVKDVERLNSQAIYTAEFGSLRQRLMHLDTAFEELCQRTDNILAEASVIRLNAAPDLKAAERELVKSISDRFKKTDELAGVALSKLGPNSDTARYRLLEEYTPARQEAMRHVADVFQRLHKVRDELDEQLLGMQELAERGTHVTVAISEIQNQFDRLSDHIRSDHRLLFTWYDKYLSYGMFVLATLASAWAILEVPAARSLQVAANIFRSASGWIILIASILGAWFLLWLIRKLVSAAARRRV